MEHSNLYPLFGNVGTVKIGAHSGSPGVAKFRIEVYAMTNDVTLTMVGTPWVVTANTRWVGVASLPGGEEITLTQNDPNAVTLYSVRSLEP